MNYQPIRNGMTVRRRSANDRARSQSHTGVVVEHDIRHAVVRWDTGRTLRILLTAIEPLESRGKPTRGNRPRRMVTLCGSTRYCAPEYVDDQGLTPWQRANFELTRAGVMVLSIGVDTKSDAGLGLSTLDKHVLDALHLDKINLSDAVVLVSPDGYIGPSTTGEMCHAWQHGIPVYESWAAYLGGLAPMPNLMGPTDYRSEA